MRVLVIDDEASMRKTTRFAVETAGHAVLEAPDSGQALKALKKEELDAVFLDLRLGGEDGLQVLPRLLRARPGVAVVMFTAFASVPTAVEAMRRGAFDFLPKPFLPDQIRAILARIEEDRTRNRRVSLQTVEPSGLPPPVDVDSDEPAVRRALQFAFRAALTTVPILISGPTGAGKGTLAREIHRRSARRTGPFVTVSCPGHSAELLERELFGHARDAFAGAAIEAAGKVAAAEGGTLFLDEIGEMPLEMQPALLRLLQDRVYERVGENRQRHANVRIVGATSRALAAEVRAGRFRGDLYCRLNVIGITLPGLCERRLDQPKLADGFMRFFARRFGKNVTGFSPEVVAAFARHSWPGNLREMSNVIERAVIVASGNVIEMRDLPDQFGAVSIPAITRVSVHRT